MANKSAKILVVEDEPALAELYAEWLRGTHEVTAVHRGETALDRVTPALDIVILDRQLPDINVDEFLDRLHTRDDDPQVAIVAGTHPGPGILEYDIADYRVKPITASELHDLVEDLLARRTTNDLERELGRLRALRAALDATPCDPQLTQHPAYQQLVARIEELRQQTEVESGSPDLCSVRDG